MILAAVKLRPEQFHTFQQALFERAEMADVVIRPQIIRRIIRLEMQRDHVIHAVASLQITFIYSYNAAGCRISSWSNSAI